MKAAAGSQVSNMEIKATEEKRSCRVEPVFNEHFFIFVFKRPNRPTIAVAYRGPLA